MFTLIYLGKFSILTNIFKQMVQSINYQLENGKNLVDYLLSLNTCWQLPKNQWFTEHQGPSDPTSGQRWGNASSRNQAVDFSNCPEVVREKNAHRVMFFLDWKWVDVQILMKRYVIVIFNLKTMKPFILLTYLSALSLWLSLLFFLPSSWIHIICTYHVCGREIQHLHLIEGPSCGQTWQVTWYSRNNQPPSDVFLWFWLWVHPPSPITVDKECIQCYGGGPILTFTFHS